MAVPPDLRPAVPRRGFFAGLAALAGGLLLADDAQAIPAGTLVDAQGRPVDGEIRGSEPFVAEISMFAGNFAPRGWAFCDGQLLPIHQNTALFALLGTTYGGDGRSTFGLPDLRGRVPMQPGAGPGLTRRVLGETGGSEVAVAAHAHTLPEVQVQRTSASAAGATTGGRREPGATAATGSATMPNVQPVLALSFIIALQGIFPPRG